MVKQSVVIAHLPPRGGQPSVPGQLASQLDEITPSIPTAAPLAHSSPDFLQWLRPLSSASQHLSAVVQKDMLLTPPP